MGLAAHSAAAPPIVRPAADEVIYQIMPIAWRDSNLDTVGSVQARLGDFGGLAAAESLDYLQYLGVTMVYLQPIFPSAAYHGYQHGAADTLNPRFGTEAQFLAFVDAAHARGIKVILDFVAYGIARLAWYASAAGNPTSQYDPVARLHQCGEHAYVGTLFPPERRRRSASSTGPTNASSFAGDAVGPQVAGPQRRPRHVRRRDASARPAWASCGEGWGRHLVLGDLVHALRACVRTSSSSATV